MNYCEWASFQKPEQAKELSKIRMMFVRAAQRLLALAGGEK